MKYLRIHTALWVIICIISVLFNAICYILYAFVRFLWCFQVEKWSDFKSRLFEEQEQLEERLNKLNEFNQSEKVNAIDPIHKSILIIQARAMQTYNECLKARLGRL